MNKHLRIYINNVLYKTLSSETTSPETKEVSTIVSFNEGDIITFGIFVELTSSSSTKYGEFSNLRICADMVDTSVMKIQEVSE